MTRPRRKSKSRPRSDYTQDESDDNSSVGSLPSDVSSQASDSSHLRAHPRAPVGGRKRGGQQPQVQSDYVAYVTRRVTKLVSDASLSSTHKQDENLARKPPEEDEAHSEMVRGLQSQMELLTTSSTAEVPGVPSRPAPALASSVHHALPDAIKQTSAESSASSYPRNGELGPYIEEWRSQIPDLTGRVCKVEKHPVAFGGFSDIWSCLLDRSSYLSLRGDDTDDDFDELEGGDFVVVAVKAVRVNAGADEEGARKCKRLFRETEVWKRLKHLNILPLFGVTFGFGPLPALVCPWMDNGTITGHLEAQGEHLSESDRWGLLSDTISGLNYRPLITLQVATLYLSDV
ncbi:hypothetical protein BS17DRAFT_311708 [Gyrodon lividus]|nr:hypothetical protein BS17DRAFT_311708 [Gyrodon lividus]